MSIGSPQRPPRRSARVIVWVALCASVVLGPNAVLGQSPLPPDRAFRFSAKLVAPRTVEARFSIAEGYYLYRDKIHFTAEPAAVLTVPTLPSGAVKDDPFFGHVETYRGAVVVNLALTDVKPGQQVVIAAESQGCADLGICYPPTVQRVTIPIPEASIVPGQAEPAKKSWFN
jgi:thiol:disulfide interchange protein DsbD